VTIDGYGPSDGKRGMFSSATACVDVIDIIEKLLIDEVRDQWSGNKHLGRWWIPGNDSAYRHRIRVV
jgi:hypothetical protein